MNIEANLLKNESPVNYMTYDQKEEAERREKFSRELIEVENRKAASNLQ